MSGYLHQTYAESLSDFGTPLELKECGGWLLERPIALSENRDAMGCYPIFACQDWSRLKTDLDGLSNKVVSVSLVTDAFGDFDTDHLRECFPDVMKPFKQHFIIDLERPLDSFVHPHHLRNARKALHQVEVAHCSHPLELLDEWFNLYQTLIDRHQITGIAAFSRRSFAGQLSVPGITMFRAVEDGTTVGMLLWYEQEDKAYYHLGAYSKRGYEVGASFALFDFAIRHFCSRRLKWLNLGAGAGATNSNSGLSRFKQGWSNGVRTTYFCGRIFSHVTYRQLVERKNTPSTDYFPAYRFGEFK